jgi:pyruvate,water dikinase
VAEKIWVADDQASTRFPVYTRGNVGEVFPTVVSPLTWALFGKAAEDGWRDAFADFGVVVEGDFGDDPMCVLGVFGGYCYLNASYIRIFAVRTPGLSVAEMDQSFFGNAAAPPYVARPGDKNIRASLRAGRTLWRTLAATALPELEDDKVVVNDFLAGAPNVGEATDAELIAYVHGFVPLFRQLFRRHISVTFRASVGPGLLAQLCAKQLDDPTLAMKLLAGIGSVESAEPSMALWDLSRLVAGDTELGALFDGGIAAVGALLDTTATAGEPAGLAEFRQRFAAFLAEFGSRGPNEWEGSSPTWGTNPALALAAIDRLRMSDADHDPRDQQARLQRERLAATDEARRRLRPGPRQIFDRALRSAQLFCQGRERSKTTVIRALHGVRLAELELARRARDRGGPPDLADMWLVNTEEWPEYVARPSAFLAVIDERRALKERLASLVPPFVFEGTQPALEGWVPRDAPVEIAKAGQTLAGIAGCPGRATGRARVVLDPADPRGLSPGEVLVAPITDPSWTPLFVAADGVVVDVGAQLSHAVIVSRELGIPCVVSVTGATTSIPDGAMVEVDGDRGVVTVLEV